MAAKDAIKGSFSVRDNVVSQPTEWHLLSHHRAGNLARVGLFGCLGAVGGGGHVSRRSLPSTAPSQALSANLEGSESPAPPLNPPLAFFSSALLPSLSLFIPFRRTLSGAVGPSRGYRVPCAGRAVNRWLEPLLRGARQYTLVGAGGVWL